MTIAVSLKVNDGLVFAADSASTMTDGNGGFFNTYNHANKITNLVKGLPVGVISWGAGSIGSSSMETLFKDLRARVIDPDSDDEWKINRRAYEVGEIANRVRRFLFDEHYAPAFKDADKSPALGCYVAGYSSGAEMAEVYLIEFQEDKTCRDPVLVQPRESCGIHVGGQPEAINRLIKGYSPGLLPFLQKEMKLSDTYMQGIQTKVDGNFPAQIMTDAMPIQDAIDLAEFLVETCVKFSRFTPGPNTIGGPIEVAAITKHEHFKWIRRKHYYRAELNPKESDNG